MSEEYINLDIEKLRKDLINYYGTAMFTSSLLAIVDLSKIENMTDEQLIDFAKENKIDLKKYQKQKIYKLI